MHSCIIIPAYKPDQKLIELIKNINILKHTDTDIILVDDGGGIDFAEIFAEAGDLWCHILVHCVNRGKGAALKTGLEYAQNNGYAFSVTADADGQHTAKDIIACLNHSIQNPHTLTLGVRDTKQMPLRSKTGNRITTLFFFLLFGRFLRDTQTGLRAIPAEYYSAFASLSGDRYEYEMNMLIYCVKHNIAYSECAIDTVYIDNNKSTHFKGLTDGLRVYVLILKQVSMFSIMSFLSFLVDYSLFAVFNRVLLLNLLYSTVFSRGISSFGNYLLNRKFVFKQKTQLSSFLRYYLLVLIIIALNYCIMFVLVHILKLDSLIAKVITEFALYFFSFKMQQRIVFKPKKENTIKASQ